MEKRKEKEERNDRVSKSIEQWNEVEMKWSGHEMIMKKKKKARQVLEVRTYPCILEEVACRQKLRLRRRVYGLGSTSTSGRNPNRSAVASRTSPADDLNDDNQTKGRNRVSVSK